VRSAKQGGETVLPPDAPAKPAKTGNFCGASLAPGFPKTAGSAGGVGRANQKSGGQWLFPPPSVLFFLSLLWYIETSHDRSRPAEHPTAWSQGEV